MLLVPQEFHEHVPILHEAGFLAYSRKKLGADPFMGLVEKQMKANGGIARQEQIESAIHGLIDSYHGTLCQQSVVSQVNQRIESAIGPGHIGATVGQQPGMPRDMLYQNLDSPKARPLDTDTVTWVNPRLRTMDVSLPEPSALIPEGADLRLMVAQRQRGLVDARQRRPGLFRLFNIFSSAFFRSFSVPPRVLRPEPVAALDVMAWPHFEHGIPVFVRWAGFGAAIATGAMIVNDVDGVMRLRYLVRKLTPWGPNAKEIFTGGMYAVPEFLVIRMALAVETVLIEFDQVMIITNEGEAKQLSYMEFRAAKGDAWDLARLALVMQYPTVLASIFSTRLSLKPLDVDIGLSDIEKAVKASTRPLAIRNTPSFAIMPAGRSEPNVGDPPVDDETQITVLTVPNTKEAEAIEEAQTAEDVD